MLYSMEYSSDPSIQSEKREGIAQLIDNIQTDVSIDLLQIGVKFTNILQRDARYQIILTLYHRM